VRIVLETQQFQRLKEAFQKANVDEKIDIYISTPGLSQEQYKELLRVFPLEYLSKLEQAL